MLLRLTPRFLTKVWGSTHLEPWFRDTLGKTGEVWFESATQLPLLVKFLFTTEALSVQVHPEGKTEMWHVLAAEPGARVAAGFHTPISKERLRESALSGEIEDLLEWHDARPGDTFFLPAGTVHAIGPGLTLCEIQQYSDITYRLFDYGRPRELHLDQAIQVSHLGPHAALQPAREGVLVSCKYFTTEKLRIAGRLQCEPSGPGNMIAVLEGTLEIGGQPAVAGQVWFGTTPFELSGHATILRTS